jgi:hypothetical protein
LNSRKTALVFHEPPPWTQVVVYGGETIVCWGRWQFLVRSKSEPGAWHCVDLEPVEDAEEQSCTCRSGETRKSCRHERVVREAFGLA